MAVKYIPLQSKCMPPMVPADVLPRERLFRRLDDWHTRRVTAVQGPPGYGKTMLVAGWLRDRRADLSALGVNVVWVSLDEDDDDPRQFLAYVMTALEPVTPAETRVVEQYLRQGKTDLPQAIKILLNGITRLDKPVLLIVDNFHHVADERIHQAVRMVVERGPANLHLMFVTRRQLPVATGLASAMEGLQIVGPDDLRLREEEVASFVEGVLGCGRPSGALVAALTTRSGGWIAGLKLAALAMPAGGAPETYLELMHGHNHWLATFFRSEFLDCQPADMQAFLLQTSILDQLTAPLCAAVTHLPQSASLLAEAVAGDFFISATDAAMTRFAYHDLFRELLRAELERNCPTAEVDLLAQRAAQWLEENGEIGAAVQQYLRVGCVEAATELIERHSLRAVLNGQAHRAQRWLNLLSRAGAQPTARLILDQGWIYLISDRLDSLAYLQSKQDDWRNLVAQSGSGRLLQQEWDVQLVIAHYLADDAARALEILNRVGDDLSADSHFLVRGGYHFLNLILLPNGPEAAKAHGLQGLQIYEANGWLSGVIAIDRTLGSQARQSGEVQEALALFRSAQRLIEKIEQDLTLEAIYVHFQLGQLLYNLNQVAEAKLELQQMAGKAALFGDMEMSAIAQVIYDLCSLAEGHQENVDRLPGYDTWPDIVRNAKLIRQLNFGSWMTRYWILAAEEEEAWRVGQRLVVRLDKSPRDQSPVQAITYLSGYIAHGANLEQLEPYLAELADFCGELNRIEYRLQTTVLLAWYWQKRKDLTEANRHLSQALDMVGQTGYVRYVLDVPDLRPLLATLPHPAKRDFPALSVDAVEPEGASDLTRQEVNILVMLSERKTNADIASALFISESTVKWHLWNIYRKMGVKGRQAAVSRARALAFVD